jgi:hypothetical protein
MVQATFTVSDIEFNAELVERIKSVFAAKGEQFEVVIRVKRKETTQEAKERIDRSIENIEKGEPLVAFTPSEFKILVNQLSSK